MLRFRTQGMQRASWSTAMRWRSSGKASSLDDLFAKKPPSSPGSKRNGVGSSTAQETETGTGTSPKKAPPAGRFWKMARDKGVPFAIYFYVFGESLTMFVTYLLHCDVLGAGDVVRWLTWIGLDKWIDLEAQSGRHVTVLGYELSVRLATNYGVANMLMLPLYPAEIAFCAVTLPYVMRLMRPLKFWGKAAPAVPKAPQAQAAHNSGTQALPR